MALTNQRICILDDRTGAGESVARLAAGLGARVTLIQRPGGTLAPGLLEDFPYEIITLDRADQWDGWLQGGAGAIDHLLIGLFEQPVPHRAEVPEASFSWLRDAYQRAYAFICQSKPLIRQSVALFSGPGLVPAGQKVVSDAGLVAEGYVRWMASALKPPRINAVWTPPVQSPLRADPTVQERQALYLSATSPVRSRFAIGEEVAQSLIYLLDAQALTGSVLRVNQALPSEW